MPYERYIILKDRSQFRGNTQSATYKDKDGIERVSYSGYLYNKNKGDLTLEQYLEKFPGIYEVLDWPEFEALYNVHLNGLKTAPQELTESQYWHYLECLPPSRYFSERGATFFHVCERLTANLVQWCVSVKGKYYGFTDDASITKDQLFDKLNEIYMDITIKEQAAYYNTTPEKHAAFMAHMASAQEQHESEDK